MTRRLKIAAIQMDVTPAPVSERLTRAETLILEAADCGAQLAVLPELFNTGYEFHERNYALAEPMDGETVTWMKAQAAQHDLHIAGTLLLRDGGDIYNAAILAAPDGRMWRYDKHYAAFWERAYFRGGDGITVADTTLGKLGMLICWDQWHPDLLAQYAGEVDALVVMSCPGDISTGDLVFPDGFRSKFLTLVSGVPPESVSDQPGAPGSYHDHAAWMGVPVVESSATGTIRTRLPLIKSAFPTSPLADRTAQAAEMVLECGFPPATQIVNAAGQVITRGTATGDGVVVAQVELPDAPPQPTTPQPHIDITPEMYKLSDEVIPAMMLPLYKEGLRRRA